MGNKTPKYTDAKTVMSEIIKDGVVIVSGSALSNPRHLEYALMELNGKVKDVVVSNMLDPVPHFNKDNRESFHHVSLFLSGADRKAVNDNIADFVPSHFSRIPDMYRGDYVDPDIGFVQVSPPDKHGYMSLGIGVDYTYTLATHPKISVAQVNKYMPRTLGDCFVHVSDFDYIVEHDEPLPENGGGALSPEEIEIGKHCAELVNSGDTLQLGIGSIPDAVMAALTDKKDLGIHTEMFSDGTVDLFLKGVINNSKKTLHKGKMVASFLMGTRKLYDFVDNNPAVYMAPVDYVNDPAVIAKNDNMVSINSCIEVDLTGQVCSESAGLRMISASGGQVDYVLGATYSKNGRAIIALNSTTKDESQSKIVPFLQEGAAVTTLRNDVNYIVTEYGIASLKGKTLQERARELINVAHPKFQDELKAEFEKRFFTKF